MATGKKLTVGKVRWMGKAVDAGMWPVKILAMGHFVGLSIKERGAP
jgi:hypothetical protein